MKTYAGKREPGTAGPAMVTVTDDRGTPDKPPITKALDPRFDLRSHSPDGFQWGYSGSGPAQLALALCADVLGDDARARRVYQRVKAQIIAPLDDDEWTMTEHKVRDAIATAEVG